VLQNGSIATLRRKTAKSNSTKTHLSDLYFQISTFSIIVVAFYLFGLIYTTLDVLPFLSIWLCILEFLNKDDRCVAFRLRELFGLLGGPVMLLLVDLVRF